MLTRLSITSVAVLVALAAAGCEKVPLLAPSGSAISVSAPTQSLPSGGSTEVTAFVMESAGTPVHNGTLVRFSATLGRVEPPEVETRGGVATTTFIAGTASGTAQIRATSGGAAGGTGADVTNVVEIQIGGAAATAVAVSANPSRVPSSGGTVTIVASSVDASGNRLVGVPITFATTAGTLSASTATTDSDGEARVTLATNREATVTARAGSQTATTTVSVGTAATVSLAVTPDAPLAGVPVTLTITPAAGTIPRVVVNWGDGTTDDLGLVPAVRTATHAYQSSGAYIITATAIADGESFGTATSVTVGSAASVTLSAPSPPNPTVGSPVTLTVTPAAGTAPRVVINWGDGATDDLGVVRAGRGVAHTYQTSGSFTITATATAGTDTFTTSTAVAVTARASIGVNISDNRSGSPQRCQSVTFTAAVSPGGESISSYQWQISSNTAGENEAVTTTGNQLTRIFGTIGTKTISATAVTPDGRQGNGQTQVSVVQETTVPPC